MVGAILVSIAVDSVGDVQQRFAVRQAQQGFAALHARTRAQAIEFGAPTVLHVDASGDSVWVARNDTTLETLRLRPELGVDLQAAYGSYRLCMNARGFGQASCTSFSSGVSLDFVSGTDTASIEMYPLGQLVY